MALMMRKCAECGALLGAGPRLLVGLAAEDCAQMFVDPFCSVECGTAVLTRLSEQE